MQGDANKTPVVKVMSFNIAHGMGMDGKVDLERAARVIEQSGATIVALQEVDRYFSSRSFYMDQVEWLSERLGMYAAYGANLNQAPDDNERPNRQYGNATLSRYPIKYAENHFLTQVIADTYSNEQRGVLETIIEVEGTYLKVLNTHLALKDEELEMSIQEIFDIAGKSHFPKIIAGDFNAPPTHRHLVHLHRVMTDVFLKTKRGDAYTYPSPYENQETGESTRPMTRIDYIFADHGFEVGDAETIETAVSDHMPITAELVWTQKNDSAAIVLPVAQPFKQKI
ncbi:endonuclease/exonuclease/phosphatase family protein [Planococcus sp. ISL-109]|uniref:endonuclease/exonuclease/phosphatase family protein n=1 Tax=Planococcus sp. ISL-109 TaxID=2819166 RepID=UPI001BEB5038|nr:endonuclease/exonuclease/phosphatase family protein [Planococcus sp. ISL-109]MBT2581501.1 endonuclease/exonuclease/phosphatase family protein [Planococcus sp. ISL-109]